jgi:hypothetical protein
MPNQQSAETPEPRKGPFNLPTMPTSSQPSSIFEVASLRPPAIRQDRRNAAMPKPPAEPLAVVTSVANQALGILARPPSTDARHANRCQRRLDEIDFRRSRRGDMYSQRNTLAVDHHHPLRTLAPLGFSDVRAPFFADANEPSMNVFSHDSRPQASSWPRNARHSCSHVPSSSHRRSRRQHVEPLGYPSGRSRQRAPVFRTQRMPSTTSRFATRGRPPARERRGRGRCGSIFAHCASVSRTLRLATGTSGQVSTVAREKVQALIDPFTRF